MKELFVLLIAAALLAQGIARDIRPLAREPKAWFQAGCGVLLTVTASVVLTSALAALYSGLTGKSADSALRLIVTVLLIVLCALGLRRQDVCPGLCAEETGGLFLTVGCSGILALPLAAAETAATVTEGLRSGLLLGACFALLSFLLAGILNRIDEEKLPAPVRGIPILALCAALIAVALMGLNGLSF